MGQYLSHLVGSEHLILSAERTIFWEKQATLIVADLHIGKTGHFRKAGIGVPQQVYKDDLHRLLSQILFFKAEHLMIVGDLSHSSANKELDLFTRWRKDFSSLQVTLVKGNHDILGDQWYAEAGIDVHVSTFRHGEFVFVHDISELENVDQSGDFYFSGHLHPAISISGRGRQSLRFPCFYFTDHYCVLPAFSRFTGTFRVDPKKGEKVFAVADKEILQF